ncbi:hypothetical protein LCGC14_0606040 [marine sediment metagenome]|uniref:TFIIS-type domain-containing protein n=1 Tax=marine sediment metagenome TaxID=412755 RepID=A0A0F9RT84_9ZZZZ
MVTDDKAGEANVILLQKCDGPPCPHCGCQDTESVQFVTRWKVTADDAAEFTRQQCNHCGGTFVVGEKEKKKNSNGQAEAELEEQSTDEPEGVIYPRLRCPQCNSKNQKVAKSPKPKVGATVRERLHKCNACGWSFGSQELLND